MTKKVKLRKSHYEWSKGVDELEADPAGPYAVDPASWEKLESMLEADGHFDRISEAVKSKPAKEDNGENEGHQQV